MATIRKPPVPAKMYRHFAVITIVLTLGLALFADGENRELMAEELAERERQAALERASAEKFGKPKLIKSAQVQQGQFGYSKDEFLGEYGSAMDKTNTSSRKSSIMPGQRTLPNGRVAIPGYPDAYIASLDEEEYEQLLNSLKQAGMFDPKQRARAQAQFNRIGSKGAGSPVVGVQ